MINSKKVKSNETGKPGNGKTPDRRRGAALKKMAATEPSKSTARPKNAERPRPVRKDSKQQLCLALLRRPKGASVEELQKGTGWQVHSVRGFLSGVVKRKLGMTLASEKAEGGSRRYRISPPTA